MIRVLLLRLALTCLVGLSPLRAATNTWAPDGQGPSDGGGSWLTGNNWWNGSAIVSGHWSAASSDAAIFGAGTNGTYLVNLGSGAVYASNVTFDNSGYILTNGSLTLETTSGNNALTVAPGIVATIFSRVTNVAGVDFSAGSGATLSLAGGGSFPGNTIATGGGTVDFRSGTFSGVNFVFWLQTPATQEAATITTSRVLVGYAGNSTYTINDPAAQLICTGSSGDNIVGRSGTTGTLDLKQGTVTMTAANNQLRLGFDNSSGSKGVLTVEGGTLNLGTNTLCVNFGGTGANNAGGVNLSSGVLSTAAIQFGNGGTYSTGSTASLNMTGGTLYLGAGGISQNALGTLAVSTVLSGGTIVATAGWSSSNAMTLATNNGNVTFQTADANDNAWDISLSGLLSGAGGLVKTGLGTLTLAATNTYSGATSVAAGTLALTSASSGGGSYNISSNATLSLQTASANSSLTTSSLTVGPGATLNLNAGSFGNPSNPLINVSGALIPAGPLTLNLSGSLTNGQFALIKYGSLGGAGFNAFTLGSVQLPAGLGGSASLVNNTTNNSIDLNLAVYPATQLVWDGTINGSWDIDLTRNWKTNAYYTETVSGGPLVIFDDTATGPNTAITLNTNVSPSGVIFSNNLLAYSLSGSGGIRGIGSLVKEGAGLLTLGGNHIFSGDTTIDAGPLALTATSSLSVTSLTFGNASPQLTFSPAAFFGLAAPVISDGGNLVMNGNVTVNVLNPAPGTTVLLQYSGTRSGSGSFIPGTLPSGATLTDNPATKTVTLAYSSPPRVIIPTLNTNEIVVAVATPQEFGAVGDGITDDSAAFQNAMNWVYNAGNWGGGVVFVPAGNYAFYTNIAIPQGVTLHGDWTDWTKGTNGAVGTTFKVYFGAGQTNAAPFIFMNGLSSLKDVNIWYPDQNPANIVGYPFSIQISTVCVVKNVGLINSYQGIEGIAAAHSSEHILSTVIGTPLYLGISLDFLADISQTEDIRFSPDIWAASHLTNAPMPGGPYAAWMRANGEGMRLLRVDGELSMDTFISGYNVGIEANSSTNGAPGATFYCGAVSNCGTALLAQEMPGQSGLQFTKFTLDGDIAVNRTHTTTDATLAFDHCQLIGRNGTAVYSTGADWHSWMAFQNCVISNTMNLAGPGVFNVVDSSLSGSTQCVLSAGATRAVFTGCSFSPTQSIINSGNTNKLIVDGRRSISNVLPDVCWTNVLKDYTSRHPAKTNLYVVTDWGASGNGINDDTVAVQNALTAAGNNGGGIVYLPPGKYHLTNTLDVPGGVELRGVHEMRSGDGNWTDGKSKASVLEPYGGQGTTNGPVALALEANSGVVGVNFNYESQNTNCLPFPAMIQGRGANVYAVGVVCPNAFYSVDLDTYTCANHLIYMVDGWFLNTGFQVGHGSSGSIVDCQDNPSYWAFNNDSSLPLSSGETTVDGYAATNAQMFVLGDCTELLIKDFNINENTFLHCVAENGRGPNVTDIGACCDGTVQGCVFDATAPCNINVVNSTMAIFSVAPGALTNDTVGVISTANFQGAARFFNLALFAEPTWDFIVGGGDVGFDLVHMLNHAFNGSSVSGGVFHLINSGASIAYNGASNFPPYNVNFAPGAGTVGKVSEIIGCYAFNGYTLQTNANNPVLAWVNYNLASTLIPTPSYSVASPLLQFNLPAVGSQNASLSWPGNIGAFNLDTTTNLTPPAWTLVTNGIVYSNGQWMANVPIDNGRNAFYRLEQ